MCCTKLFSYEAHREYLLSSAAEKEWVDKYIYLFGSLPRSITQFAFYPKYIGPFKKIFEKNLAVLDFSELLLEEFDMPLLLALAYGSFSAQPSLQFNAANHQIGVLLSVQSNDLFVKKNLKVLWGFQMMRLFEIFLNEAIQFEIIEAEETEFEASEIRSKKNQKFTYFFEQVVPQFNSMLDTRVLLQMLADGADEIKIPSKNNL